MFDIPKGSFINILLKLQYFLSMILKNHVFISNYLYFSYTLNCIILKFSETFYIKTQIYLCKAKYLPFKVFFNLTILHVNTNSKWSHAMALVTQVVSAFL